MPNNIPSNCVKNNVVNAIDLDENNLDFAPSEVRRESDYYLNNAYSHLSRQISNEYSLTKGALFGYACLIKADAIFLCNDNMKKEYFLALAEISKGKEIIKSVKDIDTLSSVIFQMLEELQDEISKKIDFEMKTKMPKEVVELKNILREVKSV